MNFTIWKIATRNLLKNKSFSTVSIIGLMLGFAGFLIVSLFIQYELTWDKQHKNYDNIYRVQRFMSTLTHAKNGNNISPHTPLITASLIEHYPEIEYATAIRENEGLFLSKNKTDLLYDNSGITADSNFLKVFSYTFTEGEESNALTEPFSIVLSKTMASALFGDEKVLGKNVIIEKKLNFKVTGVYEDLPKNSNIRPAYLTSLSTLRISEGQERNKSWYGNYMTYVLLQKNTIAKMVEEKIKDTYSFNEIRKGDKLELCPISMLHISSNGQTDYITILYMLGAVGLFILLMSVFNYVNFAISNASTRGKEVAIRKLSGVNRFGLIAQLQSETLLLSFVAALFALSIVKLILPIYNNIADTQITFTLTNNWLNMLAIIVLAFLVGVLSGIYPSLLISSRQISKLIKGDLIATRTRFDIKKLLVGLQFTISIFLICMTLFFLNQINFMTTKDLGFEKEQLLYASINSTENEQTFEAIKNRLSTHSEIIDISMSKTLPFVNLSGGEVNWEGSLPNEQILYRPNVVSYNFADNMDLEIIKGRDFSKNFHGDINNSCLINETAANFFGFNDPIGKRLNNGTWKIIGVVKDYHLKSMHDKIEPAIIRLTDGKVAGEWIFAVRYAVGNRDKAMRILKTEFETIFPNDPFEFKDLNLAFNNENSFRIYQSIKKSVLFFTVFILLLAIMGLLGIVSYTTLKRTKEIGVRKINGSSVGNIFLLLNRDFFVLIFVALIIALPLSFLGYNAIPGNYKVAPQIWIPILAFVLISIIVLITTITQTLRASMRNPVEALRYE